MLNTIKINDKIIGPKRPVYLVAEISANHNQDFQEAVKLIHAAKESGADAVKLQTYTAETITIKSNKPHFHVQGGTAWDGKTLYDLYSEAYTPWEWQPKLQKIANDIGLDFFSSAFDPTAVDFLETLNVPVHKVASFELVDIPLIEKMAATGKPLIMSTGMASLEEIKEAIEAAKRMGNKNVMLLKCTSAYPAPPEEMNLNTIPFLENLFKIPIGLSDHTLGISVPVAAVVLGACLIEKHFILSRKIKGPDSHFSLEPDEFRDMVKAVRTAEKALGTIYYGVNKEEEKSLIFRRSLFIVKDIQLGEIFTEEHVKSIRPGHGLHTRYLKNILGRKAACHLSPGTPLEWSHIAQ